MIIAKMIGGIGNQLSQHAGVRALALRIADQMSGSQEISSGSEKADFAPEEPGTDPFR